MTDDLFTRSPRAAATLRRRGCAVCALPATTLICPDCAADVAGSLAWLTTREAHATTDDDRARIDRARQILEMQG